MKFWNKRVRAAAAGATALAVIAGIGIGVANSSQAASARYVTATVGTGDVVQTYTATGTISRDNTVAAAFTVNGTVKAVAVSVGDTVDAGDELAMLKTGPLKLAVLNAETAVAQAKASLYAAQNPTSTSSKAGPTSGSGSGAGAGAGAGGKTITIDPVILTEAASRINLAVLDEAQKCEPVFGSILPAPEPSATATPTATASSTATASANPAATATSTASATPTPTPTITTTAAETTATAQPTTQTVPEPTTSASQLKALEANDPTKAELQDCANSRAEVLAANTNLQTVVTLLTTPKPSIPTPTVKKSSSSSASSSASSSNSRAVASAKASLLKADQDLQKANNELDAATLVAPISGTVGVVGLTTGDSTNGGSITIVGGGNAVVTLQLPLKTRSLVTVGQEVTVTPAGSTTALSGKLTAISTLETSGTSGTTTTYATTVAASDADQLLATGAKASVAIAVKSVTGVIRLPASAVTPTGTGTATVQVVASATADTTTSVQVKTGTVGGGWVEITEGLDAGKLVVLADRTAAIPTNSNRRRTTTTSTSSASASASASAQPGSGATSQASAQPTATASR